MSDYRLLRHKSYDRSAQYLPDTIQRKALWAQVLLGTRGRTPRVKGTSGVNARWRRTPIQGNHYYLWWIPSSESQIDQYSAQSGNVRTIGQTHTILVHSIRHHDETDDLLDPGTLADYEETPIAELDPRYDEQRAVSRNAGQRLTLSTIKGLPGSGKTISLLYLVKDLLQRPEMRRVLYVTYTSRLKRAAQEFLLAHDADLQERVHVRTLNEVESELTGIATFSDPFTDLDEFTRFLETQNPALVGPWRRYPQTLFTEIRANLLGRSFPANYVTPESPLAANLLDQSGFDPVAYALHRDVELEAAELAYKIAERTRHRHFFSDQRAAERSLSRLLNGKIPPWLLQLDALLVDEVQDLTLLQIALLGELAHARSVRRPDAPFVFTVAGDESQIVQPSGFDWGATKQLLGERVGVHPTEFEFQYQRRAPHNLARLIDNTWNFYGHLSKQQRPSARRQAFRYDDVDDAQAEEHGRILICPDLPQSGDLDAWRVLVDELADKPGRAIVDLSQRHLTPFAQTRAEAGDEAIFSPHEIKGLERSTVIIYGLNEQFLRAMTLCEEVENGNLAKFEARRLFDEMRVALSRSTDKLVLFEAPDAPVLQELEIAQLDGVLTIRWDDLLESLQTEEMSEIEVIEGYLDEADELVERGRWQQARTRNRRAFSLAQQVDDLALQRDAQEQFIRSYLHEATSQLHNNQWQKAFDLHRTGRDLALDFGDPLLQEDIEDHFTAIHARIAQEIGAHVGAAKTARQRLAFAQARETAQTAHSLSVMVEDDALRAETGELLAEIGWQWALHLVSDHAVDDAGASSAANKAAELLISVASNMESDGASPVAEQLRLLAERYQTIPVRAQPTAAQIRAILDYAERFLVQSDAVQGEASGYAFIARWMDETFAALDQHFSLYVRWTQVAQELADCFEYPQLDENLWDLENRIDYLVAHPESGNKNAGDADIARFKAFVLGYTERHLEAAAAWEALDEPAIAAEQARLAGDMEQAYQLLRRARLPIPEDLATTVKLVRLLEQVTQKQYDLRPAERADLLRRLDALRESVAASE